jgi:periplasmic divalent cation tolerance protein
MSDLRIIYTTWPDAESARAAARSLVEEGLVACANLIPGIESVYRWQGEVESSAETLLLLKTVDGLVHEVMQRVSAMHTYDVPCIIELHVESVSAPFLAWVRETMPPTR